MSLLAVSAVSVSSCDNPFFKSKKSSTSSHSGTHQKGDAHSGEFGDDGSGYNPELGDLKSSKGSLKLGPPSTNGKIVVTLPRDRCQAGTIVFGNTRCQAVGRGLTRYSKPSDRRYKQGTHSNGRSCWYLDSRYTNGATPASNYRLGTVRPVGSDKRHWGQAGIRINDNVPGRGGFVIHSVRGFTENTNAEVQNGFGCVRISQECLSLLHKYRNSGGAGQIVEVNEI
jgi:hypothetical protein